MNVRSSPPGPLLLSYEIESGGKPTNRQESLYLDALLTVLVRLFSATASGPLDSQTYCPAITYSRPIPIPAKCREISPLFPGDDSVLYGLLGWDALARSLQGDALPESNTVFAQRSQVKSNLLPLFLFTAPPDNWFQHLRLDAACLRRSTMLVTHAGPISYAFSVATRGL